MKAGCCGDCRQGRDACTMPGTCHQVLTVYPTRGARWWRDPEARVWIAIVLMCLVAVAAVVFKLPLPLA